jgi:effector-binding domain-containing protein
LITEPRIDNRPEQPTIGIRTQIGMSELPTVIPRLMGQAFGWLGEHRVPPSGAPFIRYHVINMPGMLDIEIGLPVPSPVSGDERVSAGALPAGRYASLTYIGPYEGDGLMKANAALLEWGAKQGLVWDQFDDPAGDGFVARYESYLTDPGTEPDPAKWATEVTIRVADARSAGVG